MKNPLKRLFPLVQVDIETDLISFTHKQTHVQLAPAVYVEAAPPHIIMSVGKRPTGPTEYVEIRLFEKSTLPEGIFRLHALKAFFQYGVMQVTAGLMVTGLLIGVRAQVSGHERLADAIPGYHLDLLQLGLESAKARDVEFV